MNASLMQNLETLGSPEAIAFIEANELADPQKLLLNPPSEQKAHIQELVEQIISRRKAKAKLPDWYTNRQLILPPPLSIEQSSSPLTASYKTQLIRGERLADLTGGMGIDTLYLARNFREIAYVEHDPWLCQLFRHNAGILGEHAISIHQMTAEDFMHQLEQPTTLFIDPARRDHHHRKVFRFEDCSPNVIDLLPVFRQKSTQVLIKAAPLMDIHLAIESLKQVSEVHVVSVKNEVKEVLFLLDFTHLKVEPDILCINLDTDHPSFTFRPTEEQRASVVCDELNKYLYDPNSSILKAGAFKKTATTYDLQKLAVNTHLYTSAQKIDAFPGRVFEVLEKNVRKKTIHQWLPGGKANVFTKNYPLKPEELKRQLKIRDGGELFLVGYRDAANRPQLCLLRPV